MRVSEGTHARLAALAAATGRHMHSIVDDAVAAYEASEFWEMFATGYDRLAEDAAAWAQVQTERTAEAPALADDLDQDS